MTTVRISPLSTEFVRVPIEAVENGLPENPTDFPVDMAFVLAGEPGDSDWQPADWETAGTEFLARCLVGPSGTVALLAGAYDVWVRITAGLEIPVLKVQTALLVTDVPAVQIASADELELYRGVAIDEPHLARADLLLQMATGKVQAEARQQFIYVADDVIQLHPQGDVHEIRLPQLPVLDVSSILMSISAGVSDGLLITGFEFTRWGRVRWSLGDFASLQGAMINAPIIETEYAPLITVTYTHGYKIIPDDVRGVVLASASRAWINPEGMTQEQIGTAYLALYGDAKGLALTTEEKQTLSKYRARMWAGRAA